jgi:pyrroline-5-carboxylate reductase
MNTDNNAIAFIGGGNMASAIIGGLIRQGLAPSQIEVVEPWDEARARLQAQFSITAQPEAGAALARCGLVVWAVKPQTFKDAAAPVRAHAAQALAPERGGGHPQRQHCAVAGQRAHRALHAQHACAGGQGHDRAVPAPRCVREDKAMVERVIATTGESLWVDAEEQLDAVTALSGSGPAYVFFFLEAMTTAGIEMGLSREQAHQLSVGTFVGASELARASDEAPDVLRQRVTSKGGTTYAAITSMQHDGVNALFIKALHAARQRAKELGDEFGA